MNKNEFLTSLEPFDKALSAKLYDKIALTQKSGITTYTTEFYPPNIWAKLKELEGKLGIRVSSYGIYNEAERRVIAFHADDIFYYPIRLMRISNKSKFTSLRHKDYLGALMSLGIKREKVGDLVVAEDKCYIAVYEDIFDYLRDNLSVIGKSPCSIDELNNLEEVPQAALEDKIVIATSYRIDSIVSSVTGLSRSKAVDIITGGKVLVNYTENNEKDKIIHNGDVLTIRGYGKFKIDEAVGNSSSGRIKLLVKKYT